MDASFGVVVGLGMLAGISVAAIIGTLIPMLCERIGIDPAIAAGPFVTTCNDVFGLTAYLAIAVYFI